ncbi:MAG: hypothetical protein WAP23_02270, partial [Candidatus Spechtbacterales bacterium]
MRYTRDLSASQFWEDVYNGMGAGMVLVILYAVILAACIFGITGYQNHDRTRERNLYFALAGEDVDDQRAKDVAAHLRLMYGEGVRSIGAYSSIDFGAYAPNSLKFAVDHKDRIEDIIKDPAKADEYATMYTTHLGWWSRGKFYVFLLLTGAWSLLALCVSIRYVRYALDNHYEGYRWWQYPWRRRFAYFWLPLTAPYVIGVQPWVFLTFIARQIIGA